MVKYTLIDTFNNVVVSRHRTLKAAARADLALNRAVKRHNGPTSYCDLGMPVSFGYPSRDKVKNQPPDLTAGEFNRRKC